MKKVLFTPKAPQPIGPYRQGIRIGNTLYTAGQIPIDTETGELFDGSIADQTHLVMNHLNEILKAGNMSFSHVVKSVIYLETMDDFQTVNRIYAQYFENTTPPVRETVAVKTLPKNAKIEISMIAIQDA
ncbi:MAG: Rid family detoxifying hydrolase [Flavobacteriaceae bacterium]|nr:Rid family detoxifying hydrolase [Flavobacteriaceae bacterium]MCY4267953.1 Rid family detoxifying hydrolase [Flavobacteriaceae bacterium]MCY4298425.1 Rid family detoxifying hydrolase [Flavobacteriaceae bacterium]